MAHLCDMAIYRKPLESHELKLCNYSRIIFMIFAPLKINFYQLNSYPTNENTTGL